MKDSKRHQHGFSMIEVLITILVTAVGFLGVAGMQMLNLKTVNNTQYRSIATLHAYDIAERMRANMAGVKAGHYNVSDSAASSSSCTSCTPAQMAAMDIAEWKSEIYDANAPSPEQLPEGSGKIEQVSGTSFYDITLKWKEQMRQQGASNEDGSKEADGTNVVEQEFVLRVRI